MILVIGLGSMGRRRIRCLKALGYTDIAGYDPRPDRMLPDIKCSTNFEEVSDQPEAVFICTPPDQHLMYMINCSRFGVKFFVEHGILKQGLSMVNPDFCYPSCTMLFHPEIKKLKQNLKNIHLSNILYHSGQYLPDWHPYEKVSDFYVSKKETGGAREIVPFELTWMVDLFGMPEVKGNVRKTINIEGAETIDDTYNCLLDWGSFLGVLTVDVVSRNATRRLIINTSEEQIIIDLRPGITEQIYIDEVAAFMAGDFPNTLQKEISVLRLLEEIEA